LAYHAAFGIFGDDSADDRAYRDRLATNTPTADEANKMMALAIARGDLVTQRGLAELAWNNRHNPDGYWVNVLNKWGDSDGANHEQIMALVNLEPASKVDKFQDKLYTQVVQPEDLPGSLETLAQEPEEANPWISNGPSPMGARFG
jgi:hypothetical protein